MKIRIARLGFLSGTRVLFVLACVTIFFAVFPAGCAQKSKAAIAREALALRDLGEAHMHEGNYRIALLKLQEAEQIDPKDPEIQNNLGLVMLALKQPKKAVAHFVNAVKLDPRYAAAMNNLGVAYLYMEDWDKAIPIFEKLKTDLIYATPQKPAVNLGWIYFNKGDYARAEQYYLEAVDYAPDFAEGFRGLGRVYIAQGRASKAVKALEKAVSLAPGFAEAYYDLGEACFRMGRRADCKKMLHKVVNLVPDTPLAEKARTRLHRLSTDW